MNKANNRIKLFKAKTFFHIFLPQKIPPHGGIVNNCNISLLIFPIAQKNSIKGDPTSNFIS